MPTEAIPAKDELTICFAHTAYPLETSFAQRNAGIRYFQIWKLEELFSRVQEADVLVVSGRIEPAISDPLKGKLKRIVAMLTRLAMRSKRASDSPPRCDKATIDCDYE